MKIIKHRTIYMKSTSSVPKGTLTSDSIVTSISNTPSDSKIPSEKAVKDALDAKLDTVTAGTNVSIDKTNPKAPVINVIGGGGAAVNVVTSIPLDGSATDLNVPSTKAVATEITKINSNLVALENIATGYKGLGFKSGDNTVNLKTPEINLGLNDFTIEIWARMEGTTAHYQNALFGVSLGYLKPSSILVMGTNAGGDNVFGSNGLLGIAMEAPVNGVGSNSLIFSKNDSTKNLHHIVITRQGTLVTATINGRRIRSVTQDRVLDFSKFVFDIANTTYFSLGRVFNYAMSQDEAVSLWNGGRVDEVVLDSNMKDDIVRKAEDGIVYPYWTIDGIDVNGDVINNIQGDGAICFFQNFNIKKLTIAVKGLREGNRVEVGSGTIPESAQSITKDGVYVRAIGTGSVGIKLYGVAQDGLNIKVVKSKCLLELLPQNIHSTGIYNSGSLGSSHDAVLSKPSETVFIKEPQYKNRASGTGAPNYHPIAMGQEYYTVADGAIYKASIPPVSREWSVDDWKQINM